MAEEFGKRLLMEVEEVGLEEVSAISCHVVSLIIGTQFNDNVLTRYVQLLRDVRLCYDPVPNYFHLAQLDRLVQKSIPTTSSRSPPVIEITSSSPGSGATQLLYHLTALAILPSSCKGSHACVAILDTDNSFSIPRLIQQLRLCLSRSDQRDARHTIEAALRHVHIFRPQSATSLLATLESLPSYFLHSSHPSLDRPLAFLALDSASAFYWEMKAVEENLAFDAQTQPSPELAAIWATLTTALSNASRLLSTPLVLTSHALYANQQQHAQSQRSSLPHPLSTLPNLRLQTQRVPVRKFAPCLSITEALRENEQRLQVVERGDFWIGLASESIGNGEKGFGFRISSRGVEVQGDDNVEEIDK